MHTQVGIMVEEILHLMEKRGLSPSTLKQNRSSYFGIKRWFAKQTCGEYDPGSLDAFFKRYEDRFSRQEIKEQQFQQIKRMTNYLKEYAETGNVSFKRYVSPPKYLPSAAALELIESALAATTLTDKYKYSVKCNLRRFFCYLESRDLRASNISISLLQEYYSYIFPSNTGNMDKIAHSLKILTSYLVSENILRDMPDFSCLTPRRAPKKIIPAYSKDEAIKILTSIDTGTPAGKRNYAIILLACGTGLRGCDVANLKLPDINWKSGEISIVQTKTEKPLRLPISGQIRNAVADYILSGRPKSEYQNVFLRVRAPFTPIAGPSIFSNTIARICDNAGVGKKPGRRFHSLRRSFGTWLAGEEVDIKTISQMLGHADLDSGKPYISFDDNQMSACATGFEDIPVKGGVYA